MTAFVRAGMNKSLLPVQVDLERLRAGPIEWSGRLPSDPDAWGSDGLSLLEPPKLRYRAEYAGNEGVRVRGSLAARLRLECRRCVRELEHAVQVDFDLRFDPAVQPWEEEDGVYGLDAESPVLDLRRPLREELRLAVPEYPECAGECRGLCPRCGAELGESGCLCGREEPDPRWNALRELMPDGRPGAGGRDDEGDGREG